MKLKESTFAIIAEKKDSISHKWFSENTDFPLQWKRIGQHYIYDKGKYSDCTLERPKTIPIYTESEFEALLKAEELSEICETSKLQPKDDWKLSETPLTAKVLNDPKQITISYNLALEYISERLNVDKGILKIENCL